MDKKRGQGQRPVIVQAVRTPFVRSNGVLKKFESHDLGRFAIRGLMDRTEVDPKKIEQVIYGTVIHNPPTSNVARESMLGADLSPFTPAYTVAMACISANVAATNLSDLIRLGRVQVGIAGGTDTSSDPPIRVSKKIRQALIRLQKAKTPGPFIKEISQLSLKDLVPDLPAVAEFSNGYTMGQGCERMVKNYGITREESDAFAARSHQMAAKAQEKGLFKDDIIPVYSSDNPVVQDNGPRGDTTIESLSKIRKAFDKDFGVLTAGSSSFLTDGASALLMASQSWVQSQGLTGLAYLNDYVYVAGDPLEEMLLGPALAIPELLKKNKLSLKDIGVWEIHEAFSAQVVTFLKCLEDKEFCVNRLGLKSALGKIPMEKLNTMGGSLSLGHPFGATGGRLLGTASKRLKEENERYAVVAGCAAGGHGSAILLENVDWKEGA